MCCAARATSPEREGRSDRGGVAGAASLSAAETLCATQRGRRAQKKKAGPTVVAPQVQQAYGGGAQTPAGQAETLAVRALGVFFFFILAEGLFLALSVRLCVLPPSSLLLPAFMHAVCTLPVVSKLTERPPLLAGSPAHQPVPLTMLTLSRTVRQASRSQGSTTHAGLQHRDPVLGMGYLKEGAYAGVPAGAAGPLCGGRAVP